jgi:RimJ/RimL family protein N-acetyltransferase
MPNRVDIRTADLHIRHYTLDDLDSRYQLMTQAFGSETTHEKMHQWLVWCVDNYRELERLFQPPYGDYAIEHIASGEVIGSVGIVPSIVPWGVLEEPTSENPHRVSPEFGLFWGILPAYQRKGYATQAGRAVIDYLFDTIHVRQVIATADYDNVASHRVMDKLGMTRYRNPTDTPHWFQVVGRLQHP